MDVRPADGNTVEADLPGAGKAPRPVCGCKYCVGKAACRDVPLLEGSLFIMDRRRGKMRRVRNFYPARRIGGVRPIAAGGEWSTLTIIAELAAVSIPPRPPPRKRGNCFRTPPGLVCRPGILGNGVRRGRSGGGLAGRSSGSVEPASPPDESAGALCLFTAWGGALRCRTLPRRYFQPAGPAAEHAASRSP